MRYRFAEFTLDMDAFELRRDGEALDVQAKVVDLLRVLVENHGSLVTREELHAAVWPEVVVSDDGLFQLVTKARKALDDDPRDPRFIRTVRGRGYRFVHAATTDVEPPPAHGAFFDRYEEMAALERMVGEGPLVTVVGPGGIGKTRLVREFARRRDHTFCDLSGADDLDAFAQGVASALGLGFGARSADALVDTVGGFLSGMGDHLLVLDNFEHLLAEAAPALERWVERAPEARFLVTSRRRAALPGERVLDLGPLEAGSAAALFRDRAGARFGKAAARSDHVPSLVKRLDHVPLAIELAAARTGVLSIKGMLSRLDRRMEILAGGAPDGVARHHSVQAALDWSWDLLRPEQRRVSLACASFRGGFTLEATEAVVGEPVLDVVAQLRDRSWLFRRPDEDRLRLFETIRAYLLDRLADRGETDEVLRRHAEWVASLSPPFAVPAEDALRAEADNIRAAVTAPLPPRLRVACTWVYWRAFRQRGSWEKLRAVVERAWREADGLEPRRLFVAAFVRLNCAIDQGRWDDLEAQAEQVRALAVEAAEPVLSGWSDWIRGFVHYKRGNWSECDRLLERALGLFDAVDDPWGRSQTYLIAGHAALDRGRFVAARGLYRRSEEQAAVAGHRPAVAYAVLRRGEAHRRLFEVDAAVAAFTRARDLFEPDGLTQNLLNAEAQVAQLAAMRGDLETSARELLRIRELAARIGTFTFPYDWERAFALIGLGRLDEAAALFPAIDEALSHLHPQPRADFQGTPALHAIARGDYAEAERYMARAEALLDHEESHAQGRHVGRRALCALLLGDVDAARAHADRAREMLADSDDPAALQLVAFLDALLDGRSTDEAVAAATADGRPLWYRLRGYVTALRQAWDAR